MSLKITPTVITGLLFLSIPGVYAQSFTPLSNPNSPINTIDLRGFYRGCAWVDIDNDGDLDLSLKGWALRNEGQDSFSIVQSFGNGPAGGPPEILGGISWADYDNDDDLDGLYSSTTNSKGKLASYTFIYQNDGSGHFTKKKIDAKGDSLGTWSASWSDYNNDGFADITCAVANGFVGLKTPGFFYQGSADGTFTKIDTFEFTQTLAPYTVAYWTDYDRDGDSDLFLASGPGGKPGPDFHYQNLLKETGKAGLQRIKNTAFAKDLHDGQCYNFIDTDLDEDLDLYVTNYGGAPNRFYEDQNGELVSVTNDLVFDGRMLGNCWGDFDNDGDQDLLLTADNIQQCGYFENQEGTLVKVSNPFLARFDTTGQNVSGLTIGDYDNDGDLDFFTNGGERGQNGPRGLFKNELNNTNHWVNIHCKGTRSNRAALGTVVYLTATINGQSTTQQREITAQNTFMGHNSLRVHFGLGDAEVIDELVIHWPSGQVDTYSKVAIDRFYTAVEGEDLKK
jgi:hypothetical protein